MFYDVPPLQVGHFVTRKALLSRLEHLFERSSTDHSRMIVILLGMGGAGKTQLALEWCRCLRDGRNFRAIFWLDASSRNALQRAMENTAKRLLPGRVFQDADAAVNAINDVLSTWSDRWLMVFDNLDNPPDIRDIFNFCPEGDYGSILMTSRHAGLKELGGSIVEVDQMEKEEGLELLLRSSQTDPEDLAAAEQILMRLEYLALAIDQARAYISKQKLRVQDFLEEFEQRKKTFMRDTPLIWKYQRVLPDTKVSLNLLTTWDMSLALLGTGEGETERLRDVLSLFAFFHPFSISEKLFVSDSIPTTSPMFTFIDNGHWDHIMFERAVVQMEELSLVRYSRRSVDEIVVSLHSMVSEWLRMRLDDSSQLAFLTSTVWHLEDYLNSTRHRDHIARRGLLLHIDRICQEQEFWKKDNFLEACSRFGAFYHKQGYFKNAERMHNHALTGKEKVRGSDDISILEDVIDLGNIYSDQGHFEDAERMYKRALRRH
jgi:ribosomal protein S15P/S13E